MIPVSSCCGAVVKIKKEFLVAQDMIIEEGQNPNYCSKCGKDCEMVDKKKYKYE